jgi:hypothetical protein
LNVSSVLVTHFEPLMERGQGRFVLIRYEIYEASVGALRPQYMIQRYHVLRMVF